MMLQGKRVLVTGGTGSMGKKLIRRLRPPDYQEASVSQKVVQVILSYVDYVNRTVWGRTGGTPGGGET